MIHDFRKIYTHYDLFFIDVWGVVHNGVTPYDGTVEMLNILLEEKEIFFVSNAPRPNYVIQDKLKEFGIKLEVNNVITSGDVTREYLTKLGNEGKTIYHLGEARNKDILKDIKIQVTNDLGKADLLLLTPYLDLGEDLDQFDNILKEAAALELTALCANPDVKVNNGDSFRYCAGLFAEKYEKMGGEVKYFGKPHSNIYEYAMNKLSHKPALDRILMIGDTIDTDILGAKNASIHSALVLTGNTGALLKSYQANNDNEKNTILENLFTSLNLKPNWIIKGLF